MVKRAGEMRCGYCHLTSADMKRLNIGWVWFGETPMCDRCVPEMARRWWDKQIGAAKEAADVPTYSIPG